VRVRLADMNATPLERSVAFLAAATSIGCLLLELYGLLPMRATVPLLLGPGTAVVAFLGVRGSPGVRSDVATGAWTGLVAALSYDLFRIPFVLAGMPLFKVFPAFGASITGAPADSALAQAAGWLYHFSNGASFGVMYVVALGRRRWPLGVVWALGIEIGLLLSPYARFFGIDPGVKFVVVTVLAHAVFGLVLGLLCRATVRVS
jgi:hypothetical protein